MVLKRSGVATTASDAPDVVHEVLAKPGAPLDADTRGIFHSRFGYDFSGVRIHTGPRAADAARGVGARAFTVGRDVVFGAGEYPPRTTAGMALLAHELTHTTQQVAGAGNGEALKIDDPGGQSEREAGLVERSFAAGSARRRWPQGRDATQHGFRSGTASRSRLIQRACPPTPTGLGRTVPQAPCDRLPAAVVTGDILDFCTDSDELVAGQDDYLKGLAGIARQATAIDLHGSASPEGPSVDYNYNLACLRAAAVAAKLRAAGVTAPIRLHSHGPSTVYGGAASNRNVVVVISLPAKPPPGPVPAGPPTPTPAPTPAAGTSGCTPAQTSQLNRELTDARKWVDDAVAKITAFRAGTAAPATATVVSGALTSSFHSTAPADVATLEANFTALQKALNGSFTYDCATDFWCNPDELAYVRGGAAFVRRLMDVNVCPLWFGCGNYFKRVTTLIHERAHQYPGATDNSYEWQPTYATLSTKDAIDNAESYAVTARQIFHAGGHGPGEDC